MCCIGRREHKRSQRSFLHISSNLSARFCLTGAAGSCKVSATCLSISLEKRCYSRLYIPTSSKRVSCGPAVEEDEWVISTSVCAVPMLFLQLGAGAQGGHS